MLISIRFLPLKTSRIPLRSAKSVSMNAMRGCQPRIEIYFDNIFIAHAISSNFCIGLNEKTKRQVRTARVATHKRNRYRYVMIHCISTFDRARVISFCILTKANINTYYSVA